MKKSVLFSVIVPIYNSELYLDDCIKSIINQSYSNFELFLVNDGSIDNSEKICKHYLEIDSRIKYIKQKNSGQGEARNAALKKAKGDYIIFIDSDDWVYKNYFEVCNDIISQNGTDLICFPGKFRSKERLEDYDDSKQTEYSLTILNNYGTMEAYAKYMNIDTAICTKVYSKNIWMDIRFPPIKCREDAYIMHNLLAKSNKCAICDTDYYFYYIRDNSTERKPITTERFVSIEIGEKCLELYKNKYPSLYYYCYCNIYLERKKNMLIEIINKRCFFKFFKEYKDIYKELRVEIKYLNNDDSYSNIKNSKYLKIGRIKMWAYFPYLIGFLHKIKNHLKIKRG